MEFVWKFLGQKTFYSNPLNSFGAETHRQTQKLNYELASPRGDVYTLPKNHTEMFISYFPLKHI
jgi:hypothetical protein